MHEMSLCEGVISVLEAEAARQNFACVRTVWLEIGPLAGVEIDALRFAFDVVARGTVAERAALEIMATEAAAWCMECAARVPIRQRYDACPTCGGHQLQVLSGDEMRIREVEVE